MYDHAFVIPAYKDSPYLEACIQSLIAQELKSEIILTTSTPSNFLESISKRYALPYFINNGSKGIANDWNFALSQTNAKWVTIAHQDDIYDPSYTKFIAEAVSDAKDTTILMAFTKYKDLVTNGKRAFSLNAMIKSLLLSPFLLSKRINNNFIKKMMLSLGDPICCPTVCLNKSAMPQFRFSPEYTCALDWLAWLDLAEQNGAFTYINKALVQHRIHPDSETTNQINNGRRLKEEYQIFERIWGKTIANIISKFYAIGHKDNAI